MNEFNADQINESSSVERREGREWGLKYFCFDVVSRSNSKYRLTELASPSSSYPISYTSPSSIYPFSYALPSSSYPIPYAPPSSNYSILYALPSGSYPVLHAVGSHQS